VSEKTNDEAGWAEIVEQLALRPAAAPGSSGL
jgi:hypothetical protein